MKRNILLCSLMGLIILCSALVIALPDTLTYNGSTYELRDGVYYRIQSPPAPETYQSKYEKFAQANEVLWRTPGLDFTSEDHRSASYSRIVEKIRNRALATGTIKLDVMNTTVAGENAAVSEQAS
ncbi:hypothetical protein J4460_08865 [Candidatus Woesearchaeota archaeon]|nr:hypothetical protein [Candidatus Woesearchaeota archaeon]HIH38387.1 hypothetical protein [Candidatus Woesearchaeota archaeon]HIH49624.1 hypothetical protein [Candidatus Woesearchaeota archaeon]HIJ03079.1 hypothetical protein [Candidatus Woesearchaeota archaeon]